MLIHHVTSQFSSFDISCSSQDTSRTRSIFLIQDENSEFQRIEFDADQVDLAPEKQPTCYAKVKIGQTDLMIRYPIDGVIENTPIKILPKVENQIWFGSEEDQNTEVLTIWFWTKFVNTAVKA